MALTAVNTKIATTNELRRGSTALFNGYDSTLGTGPFQDHQFHFTIEDAPSGYEYKARQPIPLDFTDPDAGYFLGPEQDILIRGWFGNSFMMGELIPGSYTVRLTIKDGGVPHTEDYDEVTFSVAEPAAVTPAETLVEVRADGTGDYTTLEAACAANEGIDNVRIEISEAGTYAGATTEPGDGLQVVGTVDGVVIDSETYAVRCQQANTVENWSLQNVEFRNSGSGSASPWCELGFPVEKRVNFGMVDVTLEGPEGSIGSMGGGQTVEASSYGLVRCFNNAILPTYGLVLWSIVKGTVWDNVQGCFAAIGCYAAPCSGERGFRTSTTSTSLSLCLIWGEHDASGRANKESARYWGMDCKWNSIDECILPGGVIGGLDSGEGTGEGLRIESSYIKRTKFDGDATSTGPVSFPTYDDAGCFGCVIEIDSDTAGPIIPAQSTSSFCGNLLINNNADNAQMFNLYNTNLDFRMGMNVLTVSNPDMVVTGFGNDRLVFNGRTGSVFTSTDNDFPSASITSADGYLNDGNYLNTTEWQAEPESTGDNFSTRSYNSTTWEVPDADEGTVPAGLFRSYNGFPRYPGTTGVRGAYVEGNAMAPRRPVIEDGDPVYAGGNRAYTEGTDLASVDSPTANYYGNTDVARFITAASGVRMAILGDSNVAGSSSRGLFNMIHKWPYTWSAIPMQAAARNEVWNLDIFPSDVDDYYSDGLWSVTTENTNGATETIASILTRTGIADYSEFPQTGFNWYETAAGKQYAAQWSITSGTSPGSVFYDPDNFVNTSGIHIRYHMAVLAGGNTELDDGGGDWDFRFDAQQFSPPTTTYNVTSNQSLGSDATTVTLGSSNGSAKLAMFSTPVYEVGGTSANFKPRVLLRGGDSFAGLGAMFLSGWVQRYESDGITPEDNIGIYSVGWGAGRAPEVFMPGADNGISTQINAGGTFATRQWKHNNFGRPNLLVYNFCYNSQSHTSADPKAESDWQADYFDLIVTDCETVKAIEGEYPQVLVLMHPPYGSLNRDRHDEIIGVVAGLNSIGVKALALDGFNRFADSKDAFNDEFDMSDAHPDDQAAGAYLYNEFHTMLLEAAADTGGQARQGGSRAHTLFLID